MKKRILLLTLMTGWDFSLHLVEKFNWVKYHFLYPYFPLFDNALFNYTNFWTAYWGFAFLICLSLLIKGGIKRDESDCLDSR